VSETPKSIRSGAAPKSIGPSSAKPRFDEVFEIEVKRTQAREFFDELNTLAEKGLKRTGEFVLPGMVKLVVQKRKARTGRNPTTGEAIKIPAKTVVKARIAKQLKDVVFPEQKTSQVDDDQEQAERRDVQAAATLVESQLLESFDEQLSVARRVDLSIDRISKHADSLRATYDEAVRQLEMSGPLPGERSGAKHGAD
jgi:DNA-binding protein HU-beta